MALDTGKVRNDT